MTYRLQKLAPGSYDVILDGVIIASLVRAGAYRRDHVRWIAELLVDGPASERPAPFTDQEHTFGTLEDACAWLGVDQIPHGRSI